MDIPRIGTGTLYRPPQAWAGRTTGAAADGSIRPDAVDASKPDIKPDSKAAAKLESKPAGGSRAPGDPLSDEQQKQVAKLKAIDTKVRQHEAAHQAAGGGLAGGASFTYQEGPDGRRYAVGGEVPIRSGGSSSPEAAIRQLEQVKRAALAPADPSGQDLAVAAQATASQAEARQQLNAAAASEAAGQGGGTEASSPANSPASSPADSPAAAEAPAGLPAPSSTAPHPEHAVGGTDAANENAAVQNALVPANAAPRALVARGVAAYGAAAGLNAAPAYATAHFA